MYGRFSPKMTANAEVVVERNFGTSKNMEKVPEAPKTPENPFVVLETWQTRSAVLGPKLSLGSKAVFPAVRVQMDSR